MTEQTQALETENVSEADNASGSGEKAAGDDIVTSIDAIPLKLQVVLGRAVMPVRDVARLRPGGLVTLDRKLGQAVDLMINDRVICRGEIAVTDEPTPRFVLKIVELVGKF
ncbi:MAG: FliM/FliN family flagellar motor switch protein [Rhodoblastus sp.]